MNNSVKGFTVIVIVLIIIVTITQTLNNDQNNDQIEVSYKKMASIKGIESMAIVEFVNKPTASEVLKKQVSRSFSEEEMLNILKFLGNAKESKYNSSWPSSLLARAGKEKVYLLSFTIFHEEDVVRFSHGYSYELYEYFEKIGVAKKPQVKSSKDPNTDGFEGIYKKD